ncbi:MAG TPA: aminopeptidase P family N-terminal domain-containing protein [bacterium]|nr:aminopeptidase P family N-terminal domain-containing protein [bacterium]
MSSFYFRNRKEKIKEQLKEKSLILILNPINCFYLTNFTSSSAMIILTNKKDYYVTDNRYYEAAKNNIKEFEVISFKKEKLFFLKKIIKNINTIFIEEDFINYKNYKNILTIKNCEIRDISDKLKEIRAIKDELEIENIKKACNISKKVINEIIKKKN